MAHRKIVLALPLLAVVTVCAAQAQQSTPRYYALSRAIKIKPGKAAEFEAFFGSTIKKLHQVRKDAGAERGWVLGKLVLPDGDDAPFHYISITQYDSFPPLDQDAAVLSGYAEKTGMSREKIMEAVRDLSSLVSTSVSVGIDSIGIVEPGDFVRVDFMKVAAGKYADYVDLERKIFKPIHEQRVKEGVISAWSLNAVLFPGGSERPHDFYTANVVKTSDGLGNMGRGYSAEAFSKVHPGLNQFSIMNRTQELRTIVRSYYFRAKEILR